MSRARLGLTPEDDGHEHVVHEEWDSVRVRRAPRVGRILGTGLVAGLLVAVFLTMTSAADPDGPMSTGLSGVMRVFGVMAILSIGAGLLLAGLVVIVLDRFTSPRGRSGVAEHATTLTDDLVSPMTDEIPQWVRDADEIDPDRR